MTDFPEISFPPRGIAHHRTERATRYRHHQSDNKIRVGCKKSTRSLPSTESTLSQAARLCNHPNCVVNLDFSSRLPTMSSNQELLDSWIYSNDESNNATTCTNGLLSNTPLHSSRLQHDIGLHRKQQLKRNLNHHHKQRRILIKSFILIYIFQLTNLRDCFYFAQDSGIRSDTRSFRSVQASHDSAPSMILTDRPNEETTNRINRLLSDSHASHLNEKPLDFINPNRNRNKHNRHHHHHRHHQNRRRPNEEEEDEDKLDATREQQQARLKRHNNNNNNKLADSYLDISADRPVVSTRKGLVRGITQKIFTGKFVDAFLGIPFAQPPVGDYRFRHPQPVNPWPGEYDASRMSNSCYQVNDTFFGSNFMGTLIWNANTPLDEDCLYLNIWTPFGVANTTISSPMGGGRSKNNYSAHKSNNSKRPVLVWIFGGGFYSGTSTLRLYEGGALASEEDIIVVSMNYRVSALGFLYFGRPDAPGNSGLFDQLLALQWINDNIDQFGGDPARVTIFGESAGAVSVAFHLLSPLSRNLFSQAILQSGAATCPWGSMGTKEIIANGLQLAALLKCPSNQNDLDAVINCLLKADPMALVSQEVGQTRSVLNFPFVPIVDGSFLLEPPGESLAKANFKQARILLGSNNDEANAFLIYLPEFSNCPTTSGNEGAPTVNTNEQPTNNRMLTSDSSNVGLNKQNGNEDKLEPGTTSLRDLTSSNSEDIESLELVAFGRQSSNLLLNSQDTDEHFNPQQNSNVQLTKTTHKQPQQVTYTQNDSKPCKPNEFQALNRDDFVNMLREDLNPYAGHPIAKKAIVYEYSNWNDPQDSVSYYDAIDKIVGDYHFTCHVSEFAYHYAQAENPVFMYHFKHRSSMSPWPKWMGVLHGDEINFVFGEPLNPVYNYTKKEIELSRRMMKYWANFAKFGNPTNIGDNESMTEKWPEYKDKRQYFELNSDYIRVGRGPRAKQCAFWSQYLPQLIQSFDRNNQCQPLNGDLAQTHRIPPFPASRQYGHLKHDSSNRHHLPFSTTPSVIIFSFIVILILVAATGIYIIFKKNTSWKFNLWTGLGGGSSSTAPDEDEAGETNNRAGRSRVA